MLDADQAERRVTDAEAKLGLALRRLRSVRRDALTRGFDPVKHGPVIAAYREAECEVLAARLALAPHAAQPASTPAPIPDVAPVEQRPVSVVSETAPLLPRSRVRVVRWLGGAARLIQWSRA